MGYPSHLRLSRVTALTESSARSAELMENWSTFRFAMKKWRLSWPAPMQSSPAKLESVWRLQGPGAIHLLNGLYDAKMDHQPVGGHYRTTSPSRSRRPLPARGRPNLSFQGCGARICTHGFVSRSGAPSDRPRDPDRKGGKNCHLRHYTE